MGKPALSKQPSRKIKNETKPVELFKLHLGKLQENLKPNLPIEYKKAITDYLCEFGKVKKSSASTYLIENLHFMKLFPII